MALYRNTLTPPWNYVAFDTLLTLLSSTALEQTCNAISKYNLDLN